LLVGAVYGRGRGLIVLGVVLALATTVAAVVDAPLHGGVGERHWRPASTADLDSSYRLGVGQARLNLSRLALTPGDTVHVQASVGVGELVVILPRHYPVDVGTRVNLGGVDLPGLRHENGSDVHLGYRAPSGPGADRLFVDLEVGV